VSRAVIASEPETPFVTQLDPNIFRFSPSVFFVPRITNLSFHPASRVIAETFSLLKTPARVPFPNNGDTPYAQPTTRWQTEDFLTFPRFSYGLLVRFLFFQVLAASSSSRFACSKDDWAHIVRGGDVAKLRILMPITPSKNSAFPPVSSG